jgi:signal transduction histidine kinase
MATRRRSAAWALSLRPTVAFALVTTAAFALMYLAGVRSIREHNDAWLRGEVDVLSQVSADAPQGALHAHVMLAIARSAAHEVTGASHTRAEREDMIFFLQTASAGQPLIWLGPSPSDPFVAALMKSDLPVGKPRTVPISGRPLPYRVVRQVTGGADLYLGLSDAHAIALMQILLGRLGLVWVGAVSMAWIIAFASARRMLARVESITTAAAAIRSDDLSTRVPGDQAGDEIGSLARTLNGMLDRLAASVNQLRSLTDTVAHELKSPVTSIRGRLENALPCRDAERWREIAILTIEDLDRLAAFVTTTLDLSVAAGGGLSVQGAPTDFGALVRDVLALYEPVLIEQRRELRQTIPDGLVLELDVSLMQRAVANLIDNELRHTRPGTHIMVTVEADGDRVILRVEDDGPGFPPELEARMFERFVKGGATGGHGLGLAFTRAAVDAHGGTVSAQNGPGGGACVSVTLTTRRL